MNSKLTTQIQLCCFCSGALYCWPLNHSWNIVLFKSVIAHLAKKFSNFIKPESLILQCCQMNQFHTLVPYCEIIFNIIPYEYCSSPISRSHYPNNIPWRIKITEFHIMPSFRTFITLCLVGPYALRTMYSNILKDIPKRTEFFKRRKVTCQNVQVRKHQSSNPVCWRTSEKF